MKRSSLCTYSYYRPCLSRRPSKKFMMAGREIARVFAVGVGYCAGSSWEWI